ncbi:MAG: type II secretion system F family protein [DPANN group archaeon]|nr:type II secretion system F family protein [DPANN group archaeon]
MDVFEKIGSIFPGKLKDLYALNLKQSYIKSTAEKYLGISIVGSIGLTAIVTAYLSLFSTLTIYHALGAFLVMNGVFYFNLSLSVDKKTRDVNTSLPDALQLMATNLRAGFTPDKALFLSAKEEFGPLEEILKQAGKEILSGTTMEAALKNMNNQVSSEKLETVTQLITQGIKAGGELSELLDHTAIDIQDEAIREKELKASILLYSILIFIAIAFGGPFLFGVSSLLTQTLKGLLGTPQGPAVISNLPVSMGEIKISEQFMLDFSIAALLISSISGSLIIGLIQGGKEKQGLKLLPIILAISMIVFYGTRVLLAGMLSNVFA